MITYNGIIEYFKEVANKHTQINSFSFGDIDDADLEKITEYPLLHVGVTNATLDERVVNYDINLMLIEIIDDKGDAKTNEKFALSNTLQVLQDLQTEFLKGKHIVTPQTKLTGNALTCSPITGNYNNRVVGWSTLMTIEGANESTACNIPYNPITAWAGRIPTPPMLNNINYSWLSATEGQYANLDYNGNDYITNLVPFVNLANLGNLRGEVDNVNDKLVYNFTEKAIHIKSNNTGTNETGITKRRDVAVNDYYFFKIKDITGGTNNILTFETVAGNNRAEIVITNGSIFLKNYTGTVTTPKQIHGLQSGNPILTNDNDVIRKEPFTFCLQVLNSSTFILHYDGVSTVSQTVNVLGSTDITIGTRATELLKANYKLQEFVFFNNGSFTDENVNEVILWLNEK